MKTERRSFYDWLAVGLLRNYEERSGGPILNVPTAGEDDFPSADPSRHPYRFLAERAESLLPKMTGITPGRIRLFYRMVIWTPILCVLLLGLSLFPFGKVKEILGGDELVNLAGYYSLFMGFQILFLLLSLIALLWSIISFFASFFLGQRKKEAGAASGIFSSWLGYLLIGLTRQICPLFDYCRGRLKKGGPESAESASERSGARRARFPIQDFFDLFFHSRRPLLFFGGFLSHLFWLILSSSVLLILVARMQSNRYEYCWRSSLGDRDQVKWLVERLGSPVSRWISLPSDRDIDWLFENSAFRSPSKENRSVSRSESAVTAVISPGEESKIRRRWSLFLLALVFVFAVLPRLLLTVVYGGLFCWTKRDFKPNLSDPYYSNLIDLAKMTSRTASEIVHDDRPDNEPLSKPIFHYKTASPSQRPPSCRPSVSSKSSSSDDPSESFSDAAPPSVQNGLDGQASPPNDPRQGVLALGYDVELPDRRWESILGSEHPLYLFGNVVKTRKTERDFLSWLTDRAGEIGRTILLIDSGFPPAKQIRLWMQNDLFGRLPFSKNYVILSCGERLRRKFGENVVGIGQRLSEWTDVLRQMEEALGRPVIPVTGYDHELDAEASRRRLTVYFQTEFGNVSNEKRPDNGKERGVFDGAPGITASTSATAGTATFRFPESKGVILIQTADYLSEVTEKPFSDEAVSSSLQNHLTLGYSELLRLYRQDVLPPSPHGEGLLSGLFHKTSSTFHFTEKSGDAAGKTSGFAADSTARIREEWRERLSAQNILPAELSERLAAASGMIDKASALCHKLSPKSALLFGVTGASLPLAAACAPLLAGGMTVGALVSALTGMGVVLPTALVTGSAGAIFGSVVPLSLSKLRENCAALIKKDGKRGRTDEIAPEGDVETETIMTALSALTVPLLVWTLIFELQGRPEDEIADELPRLLAPLDETPGLDENRLSDILDEIEMKLAERNRRGEE